jgi:hypothetical protein
MEVQLYILTLALHAGGWSLIPAIQQEFFCNPILFAICTSTFSKLCKNVYIGK